MFDTTSISLQSAGRLVTPMSDTNGSLPQVVEPHWWLSTSGETEGPYGEAAIVQALQAGQVSPQAFACPHGGQEWRVITEWPAFAATFAPQSPLGPGTASVSTEPLPRIDPNLSTSSQAKDPKTSWISVIASVVAAVVISLGTIFDHARKSSAVRAVNYARRELSKPSETHQLGEQRNKEREEKFRADWQAKFVPRFGEQGSIPRVPAPKPLESFQPTHPLQLKAVAGGTGATWGGFQSLNPVQPTHPSDSETNSDLGDRPPQPQVDPE